MSVRGGGVYLKGLFKQVHGEGVMIKSIVHKGFSRDISSDAIHDGSDGSGLVFQVLLRLPFIL